MNVVAIREDVPKDICAKLAKAMTHAEECDSVLILMEKRNGGILWFCNGNCTLMAMNWMLDSMKHILHDVLSRKKNDT